MDFNLIISPRAQKEIENAAEFYFEINSNLGLKFFQQLESSYEVIVNNPFYQKRYKDFKAFSIKKFPFLLFFIIDDEKNTIRILSCFHTSRDSIKHPK